MLKQTPPSRRNRRSPGSRIAVCLAAPLLLTALKPADAHQRSHHRHSSSVATYFSRGDSNPHLANGDRYGDNGPWFCAVDASRRGLLNHRIRVVNTRNGRSHVFLVADLGRFGRGNIDVSRSGSARLSGHARPDNFPVEWHDLGPAPKPAGKRHHRHHRH